MSLVRQPRFHSRLRLVCTRRVLAIAASLAGRTLAAVLLMVAALVPRPATADTVTIDFERFPGPDGILGTADDTFPVCDEHGVCEGLGDQFSTMGVTFAPSGLLFQDALFPGTSASNHYVSSAPPDATFSIPVFGISITSYSFWTATLYALDEAGHVIASDTLTNPNAGSAPLLGTLSVATTTPIHRFTVLAAGCEIGGPCSQILNLDDLVLMTNAATPVTIDIRPGDPQNTVVAHSDGVIRVAILSTTSFDATTVEPATVRFGATGTEATAVHWSLQDVDENGQVDVVLYFKIQDTGIQCGETEASVTGKTVNGVTLAGADSVRTVPCR